MLNFKYYTPTKLIFGKGSISELESSLKKYGKNVLLAYGGGSIKKIGLYEKIKNILKDFNIFELDGIKPNPKYKESVLKGIEICKKNNIDVILAVGGGSVLDCSKAIAVGALYEGDVWDILTYKAIAKSALPIIDVLTLAATGSEFDGNAVISRTETNDKVVYSSDLIFPKISILDPEYTYSVSKLQTAAGTADAINHILEQFFVKESTMLNDAMMASAIKSLMINVKKALKNPNDYNARYELMYDATLACNGIFSNGSGPQNWPMHGIEHALSGYYDITHGVGLAIITPRWMEYILCDKTVDRFDILSDLLFDFKEEDKFIKSKKLINEFYKFFESIGIPMHLKDLNIDESRIKEMASHINKYENLDNEYAFYPLKEKDIEKILINSL